MFYRQKLLLALLDAFGGRLARTDLHKHLFLYARLCEGEEHASYDFVPYRFGCFSFQASADRFRLIGLGCLEDIDGWKLTGNWKDHAGYIPAGITRGLSAYKEQAGPLKGKTLVRHVYKNYPYYAINSEVVKEYLSGKDYSEFTGFVKRFQNERKGNLFATIGYEGISIDKYLDKLVDNGVQCLVDVRKNPLSRKYGFSKSKLCSLLDKLKIQYRHIPELGIASEKRQNLESASRRRALFREYEKTVLADAEQALSELRSIYASSRRIAITCFERCHTLCHRHKVAEAVEKLAGGDLRTVHL